MANPVTEVYLRKHLDLCLAVYKQYSWLVDSYILDFFVEHHFNQLPQLWSRHLKSTSIQELARFINFENCKLQTVWPLSLIVLRCVIKQLCLPRRVNHINFIKHEKNCSNKKYIENLFQNLQNDSNECKEAKSMCSRNILFRNAKLKTLFIKHVKPKKRYEIVEMAKMTSQIADLLDVKYLVDIGSGLGHLSRISGYGFGLNVLSIESQESFFKEAQRLYAEFEVTASKHLNEEEMKIIREKRPLLVQKTITSDITPDHFSDLLKKSFNVEETCFKFGIVGLHPCGNLALKLLQLFIHCKEAKFINIVGCCYHKVTVSSNAEIGDGFPASAYCKRMKEQLSREARAMACHALESYCKRLETDDYDHLKIHCYRATLENIISKNWPHLRKSALNNVKHGPNLYFKLYCQNALKKTGISVSDEDLESQETLRCLSEWKDVVLYYSLRLMLAPLIETIILLDRMLYVTESGYQCSLQALFEPEMSPRNIVLSARKC